ncbi:MAG: hypothetical protein KGL04_00360 [Elusimicrobia bacterium]|nr:hypothetical protein [Elusimicrobiota bacterium]
MKLRIIGRVQGGVSRVTHEYRLPGGKTRQDTLALLAIKPAEFDRLLAKSGFRVVAKYGGFDRRPFTGVEAEHIVKANRG